MRGLQYRLQALQAWLVLVLVLVPVLVPVLALVPAPGLQP
jgi:hypothetical protein